VRDWRDGSVEFKITRAVMGFTPVKMPYSGSVVVEVVVPRDYYEDIRMHLAGKSADPTKIERRCIPHLTEERSLCLFAEPTERGATPAATAGSTTD